MGCAWVLRIRTFQFTYRWKIASGGKFGYSVQRDIWNQQQKRWAKFIKQLDWVTGENNIYRKWPAEFTYSVDAPRGHLPLTNALRGTQVGMEHITKWA